MRTFLERDFPRLLDHVYDAAFDPDRWPRFLDALAGAFDNATGIFYLYDTETGQCPWTIQFNSHPAFAASFLAHYGALNPYRSSDLLTLPVGHLVPATNATAKEVIEQSEFYNDWMRPQGIPSDHPAVTLFNDGSQAVVLGLAPPDWAYRRQRDTYERKLALLIPHLMRAIEINRRTEAAGAIRRMMGSALEALELAAIVVGAGGRPVALNSKAEALLAEPGGALSFNRFGGPSVKRNGMDLMTAIGACLASRRPAGPLLLRADAPGRDLIAWLVPLSAEPGVSGGPKSDITAAYAKSPCVLVVLAPAREPQAIAPDAIASAFGLSMAEARLASAIVAGRSLTGYARVTGHSRNTLRNQLASIFAKTGTRRQTELVALIVGMLGNGAGRRD